LTGKSSYELPPDKCGRPGVGERESPVRRTAFAAIVAIFPLMLGCASPGISLYIDDMYHGRQMLVDGAYGKALVLFVSASENQKSAAALAFAGVTYYKMGEIQRADDYLTRAQAISAGSDARWLILGYRSLVFFKEGRGMEGLQALKEYRDLYRSLEPQSKSLAELDQMVDSGLVDAERLDLHLDQQVKTRYIDYNQL
jgi:hypothetical protein